jgi:CheY-like chemotaxis protein
LPGGAGRQQPDLAIVDIDLREMTGYELAQHLRGDAATQAMGLVALTGYGQEDDRQQALASGFDFHLVKSVDIDHRLVVIDRCGQAALRRCSGPGTA